MSVIPLFDAITPIVNKVLDFIPDPQQKLQAQQQLLDSLRQWDAQQAAINQQEAASSSLFIAGWRPAVGWCCALAFIYHLILQPFLTYCMAVFGHTFPLPVFDTSMLNTTLMGMLGLGGMRTFEKIKGIK